MIEGKVRGNKHSPIKEALKAVLRFVFLLVIALIIASNIPIFVFERDTFWIILVLLFIDKWLHVYGKNQNNSKLTKGLTRF